MKVPHPRSLSIALLATAATPAPAQVPLSVWTNGSWPSGLQTGDSRGVSWGDYDADGWVDFFVFRSGELYRNLQGVDWQLAADLNPLLPPRAGRYGVSFADYNKDGLLDLGTEPRRVSGPRVHFQLLKNLGGGANFLDVAADPLLVDVRPYGDSETLCWADVDADGYLDAFLPVYPPAFSSPGNFFLWGRGPTGPGGEFAFLEWSQAAGLDNPAGTVQPEGAEFVDVDGDGDVDLFSNETLYQNVSQPGAPTFLALGPAASGIRRGLGSEEGALFVDYDRDSDFDLLIAYCSLNTGARIWENRGDGTFFLKPMDLLASNGCLGASRADWDNDGDVDLLVADRFFRNRQVETGSNSFALEHNSVAPGNLTPAWADWDRDGDLDALVGSWGGSAMLYENTLYDESTPLSERRFVRVKAVADSATVAGGVATEYGALVDVRVRGDTNRRRRRAAVSSAAGYVNQDDYTLHFGLPPDPVPEDHEQDLHFDVRVRFLSDPSLGPWQVDSYINPVLANIRLAALVDRELRVFRSGRVWWNGCDFAPRSEAAPQLLTTSSGLLRATNGAPLAPPTAAPASNWFVGVEFDTDAAPAPVLLKEIILDGVLDGRSPCGPQELQFALWDVTQPASARRVRGGTFTGARFFQNRRSSYPVAIQLDARRTYRLVAAVSEFRTSPIAAPQLHGPVTIRGGLSYQDLAPCQANTVVGAATDLSQVSIALRFDPDPGNPWGDLGQSLPGSAAAPTLMASGVPQGGRTLSFALSNARPLQRLALIAGTSLRIEPLQGGKFVPQPEVVLPGRADAAGNWSLQVALAPDLPGETLFCLQVWQLDPLAPTGWTASNAVAAVSVP